MSRRRGRKFGLQIRKRLREDNATAYTELRLNLWIVGEIIGSET